MRKLIAVFSIPELRQKILITLGLLAVYRIGYFVPLPVIDQARMQEVMQQLQGGALGQVLGLVSLFSGGNLSQACIFGLGIMPYISSSIIFQLLASVYPPLEKLQKEGESGRNKINEYTRYATVPICMLQAFGYVRYVMAPGGMAHAEFTAGGLYYYYLFASVLTMTAGTIFLMWLGEQIDEYGIGNGISLIIMAGILARLPAATGSLLFEQTASGFRLKDSIFTLGGTGGTDISFEKMIVLILLFVAVVVGVIAIVPSLIQFSMNVPWQIAGFYGGTGLLIVISVALDLVQKINSHLVMRNYPGLTED